MDGTTDIVEQSPTVAVVEAPENIFADRLDEIKNERGERKYNSVNDALKGAAHAQEYIKTLKEELDALKEQVELRKAQEKVMEVLNTPEKQQVAEPVNIEALVEKTLAKREQQTLRNVNLNSVNDVLVKKFGTVESAKAAFEERAKSLGVGSDFLQDLAARSPKAVLELFGESKTQITINSKISGDATPPIKKQDTTYKSPFNGDTGALLDVWRSCAPE
jgi:hypothetical protein